MNEGTILNSADIEDLQRFARSLEHALSEVGQNERLEDTFKLRRKFRGVVGELITLLKLYEQCGPSCRYIWYGGGKPEEERRRLAGKRPRLDGVRGKK